MDKRILSLLAFIGIMLLGIYIYIVLHPKTPEVKEEIVVPSRQLLMEDTDDEDTYYDDHEEEHASFE